MTGDTINYFTTRYLRGMIAYYKGTFLRGHSVTSYNPALAVPHFHIKGQQIMPAYQSHRITRKKGIKSCQEKEKQKDFGLPHVYEIKVVGTPQVMREWVK